MGIVNWSLAEVPALSVLTNIWNASESSIITLSIRPFGSWYVEGTEEIRLSTPSMVSIISAVPVGGSNVTTSALRVTVAVVMGM